MQTVSITKLYMISPMEKQHIFSCRALEVLKDGDEVILDGIKGLVDIIS